jgi:hypothetical protein
MVGRSAPTAAWSDAPRRQLHGRTLRADSCMVGRSAPTAACGDFLSRNAPVLRKVILAAAVVLLLAASAQAIRIHAHDGRWA